MVGGLKLEFAMANRSLTGCKDAWLPTSEIDSSVKIDALKLLCVASKMGWN